MTHNQSEDPKTENQGITPAHLRNFGNQSEALDELNSLLRQVGHRRLAGDIAATIPVFLKERELALLNRIEEGLPEKLHPIDVGQFMYMKAYNEALDEVRQLLQKEREKLE